MKETHIAYMAGLLDGDGCILITKDKRGYYGLTIAIGLTNYRAIKEIASLANGYIVHPTRKNKSRRNDWRWELKSRKAAQLLQDMLPYLIVKRPQAELALKFQARFKPRKHPGQWGFNPHSPEEWAERERLYWQMRILNNHRNLTKVPIDVLPYLCVPAQEP